MASSITLNRRLMFKIKKYALAYFQESDSTEIIATQHICSKEPKIGNEENNEISTRPLQRKNYRIAW